MKFPQMTKPTITALTPTGARPEAFAECVRQMRAQTASAVRWVIVDDGPEPMPTPDVPGWDVIHLRPEPVWQPGQNTLARNLLAGLREATDRVAICEDDDGYAPDWLDTVNGWLDRADLVGESHSLYVNGDRRVEMGNAHHASLCSTGVKGDARRFLRWACTVDARGIDLRLWKQFRGRKALHRPEPRRVTGIKGYPGRPGLGIGHRL